MSDTVDQTNSSATSLAEDLARQDWEFSGAETKYLTHGLHPYPARMPPQIPARLLKIFLRNNELDRGDWLYDPFVGSGTSIVEARLHDLNAVANDVNPLACMLTRAKVEPIDTDTLRTVRERLFSPASFEESLQYHVAQQDWKHELDELVAPDDINISKYEDWFPTPQLQQLLSIKEIINNLQYDFGERVVRFLRIALSSTTRKVSYQRNSEYKRYRMAAGQRRSHHPNVASIFKNELDRNISRMERYEAVVDTTYASRIRHLDSTCPTEIASNRADVIITSPPYGDHATTVAYGQFSQDPTVLSSDHDRSELTRVDDVGLGGDGGNETARSSDQVRAISDALDETIELLEEREGRSEDAIDFFTEFYDVVIQTRRILKSGKLLALVVGNRTMSRVNIPTHLITTEFYHHLGFRVVASLPREIPQKTLPLKNAPENIPGETGDTMAEEYILVFRAPDW